MKEMFDLTLVPRPRQIKCLLLEMRCCALLMVALMDGSRLQMNLVQGPGIFSHFHFHPLSTEYSDLLASAVASFLPICVVLPPMFYI